MSQSSDDERQLPPSVEAASQMVYRSSGLGVWGAVLRFGGMPLEKIALFSNSSQVSGKGQLGQAVKLTFAEGMLAPFRVVGPASFVAWFLQYSVMGFVFQSCDRTLSKVMGVPNVYYGDELFEPGNRPPRRKRPPGSRPPPPHPRGPACSREIRDRRARRGPGQVDRKGGRRPAAGRRRRVGSLQPRRGAALLRD